MADLNGIFPRPDGLVIEREDRGHGVYWVHAYGPNTGDTLRRGRYVAAAQARLWARELGMSAGGWISGGGSWNGKPGGGNWARVSASYAFKSTD